MHHRYERIRSYQKTSHPRFTRADVVGLLVGAIWALWSSFAIAAEGGSSLYLPGGAGDILLALSPEPGLQVANGVFVQSGSVNTAVLQGRVDVGRCVERCGLVFGGHFDRDSSVTAFAVFDQHVDTKKSDNADDDENIYEHLSFLFDSH